MSCYIYSTYFILDQQLLGAQHDEDTLHDVSSSITDISHSKNDINDGMKSYLIFLAFSILNFVTVCIESCFTCVIDWLLLRSSETKYIYMIKALQV